MQSPPAAPGGFVYLIYYFSKMKATWASSIFFVKELTMGVTINGRIVATAQAFTVEQYFAMEGTELFTSVGISTAQARPTMEPAIAPAFVVFLPSVPKT